MVLNMKLKGRVALITGAGSGLGLATAKVFAAEGAVVAAVDQHISDLDSEIAGFGENSQRRISSFELDVTDRDGLGAVYEKIVKSFGQVDILVNNAGIAQIKDFVDISPVEWRRMMDVHVKGAFLCSQAVLPSMIDKRWGRIINTASVAGMTGGPRNAHYATAKASIVGFTRSLALEYARYGITVNAVAPGLINTPMVTRGTGADKEKVVDYFTRRIPVRKLGEATDIAKAHLYLASEDASYITGQILSPNGGFLM